MDTTYSIWKNEECIVCKGLKVIESLNNQNEIEYVSCPYCQGKGFIKVLKSDYDY